MKELVRLVDLLHDQKTVVVLAKADQAVPPAADRAHEVQAEAIDVRLSLVGLELGAAANALPHNASVRP